jgi:hypothetical protein
MSSVAEFPFLPILMSCPRPLHVASRRYPTAINTQQSCEHRTGTTRGEEIWREKRNRCEEMRKDLTHVTFFHDIGADNVFSRSVVGHHLGVTHNTWPTYISSIPTVREKRSERSTMSPTCLQLNCLKMLLKTRRSRHWQYDIRVKVAYCVLSLNIPCNHMSPTLPMLSILGPTRYIFCGWLLPELEFHPKPGTSQPT